MPPIILLLQDDRMFRATRLVQFFQYLPHLLVHQGHSLI